MQDKRRGQTQETDGSHPGTWVSYPGLVSNAVLRSERQTPRLSRWFELCIYGVVESQVIGPYTIVREEVEKKRGCKAQPFYTSATATQTCNSLTRLKEI